MVGRLSVSDAYNTLKEVTNVALFEELELPGTRLLDHPS
jgi:hypothetical protein